MILRQIGGADAEGENLGYCGHIFRITRVSVEIRQYLESTWRFQQIDYGDSTTFEFLQLDAIGDRLVGRVNNNDNLYYSDDGGASWDYQYKTWLDGVWTNRWIPYTNLHQAKRYTYIEEENSWYTATWQHWPNDGIIIIEWIGSPDTEIARLPCTFTPGNEFVMDSPDGVVLVVFEVPGTTNHVLSSPIDIVESETVLSWTPVIKKLLDSFLR